MAKELIKSREELERIADALTMDSRGVEETIVSRYIRVICDTVTYLDGKENIKQTTQQTSINKEWMGRGLYTRTDVDDLFCHNQNEVFIARNLQKTRFQLPKKGLKLPENQGFYSVEVPAGVESYDQELAEFTRNHPNTRLTRELRVEQRVITNSQGGIAIQSIPFFSISYGHGYEPSPTYRILAAVCSSDEDIRRFKDLIRGLSDPTLDKKIKNATSFSEAFHNLHALSRLQYENLEKAGLSSAGLRDIVVLTGTPVHEVFGHQFEEPVNFLDFSEIPTFRHGQEIRNKDIVIADSPKPTLVGFNVLGFTVVDAYGRKRGSRILIKDGKCVDFLGSEYADLENLQRDLNYQVIEKHTYAGNASQYIDGHFPQPRMSCTILDGKTESTDLEGKLVVVPHAGYTRLQDKTYVLDAKEGYVIKNGIPHRISPVKISGGIYQALANLTLLEDWNYTPGMCGKASPITKPQEMSAIMVSEICRTQIWRDQQVFPLPLADDAIRQLIKKS